MTCACASCCKQTRLQYGHGYALQVIHLQWHFYLQLPNSLYALHKVASLA